MEPITPEQPASRVIPAKRSVAARGCGCTAGGLAIVLVILGGLWFLLQPGLFVIQPLQALPEGVTLVYHSRPATTPFVLSPDGLCLETMGEVTLFCRLGGIAAASQLSDRILLRLPYNHTLYLISTGGREFDR